MGPSDAHSPNPTPKALLVGMLPSWVSWEGRPGRLPRGYDHTWLRSRPVPAELKQVVVVIQQVHHATQAFVVRWLGLIRRSSAGLRVHRVQPRPTHDE
jgi:hypothetical protein